MSKLKELKSFLELYPRGTHFCMATKQNGYALDAEMLIGMVEEIETLRAENEQLKYEVQDARNNTQVFMNELNLERETSHKLRKSCKALRGALVETKEILVSEFGYDRAEVNFKALFKVAADDKLMNSPEGQSIKTKL